MTTCAAQDYGQVFAHRGDSYSNAMRDFPHARDAEFRGLLRHLRGKPEGKVADIPSGGGYLSRFIREAELFHAYDPAEPFRDDCSEIFPVDLEDVELVRSDYDLIISLASIHHVEDKATFLRALIKHCAPKARIVLADVIEGSRIALFLDEFVGLHNSTGHKGWFFSSSDPFDFGREQTRFDEVEVETLSVPWVFPTRPAMVRFCRMLFGTSSLDPIEMERALDQHIGIIENAKGVSLQWELTYIHALLR